MPTGKLRGAVVTVHGMHVIFYPLIDGYLALYTTAHEIGHVVLNHQRLDYEAALQSNIYSNSQEAEAEQFARELLALWHVEHQRRSGDPDIPPALHYFFSDPVPESSTPFVQSRKRRD